MVERFKVNSHSYNAYMVPAEDDETLARYVRYSDYAALEARCAELEKALDFYADPEHWRTRNASGNLDNVGYGLAHHQTNPDGQMEVLAANCGQWVPSKHMVHGGHWQADAGHVARRTLSGDRIEREPVVKPFYVIDIPINSDGQGPCTVEEATSIIYEVWDQSTTAHGSYGLLSDAIRHADRLNFASAPERVEAEPDFAKSIAYVIKEESAGGAACGWRSCTGCHENNEGVPQGPYSTLFQTHVGMGCSECGGIGVTWEYWSEDVLAAMQEDASPPAPVVTDESPLEIVVAFVARMCWRTDPPNANNPFTESERFSAIKHHPTIKHYGRDHAALASREANR